MSIAHSQTYRSHSLATFARQYFLSLQSLFPRHPQIPGLVSGGDEEKEVPSPTMNTIQNERGHSSQPCVCYHASLLKRLVSYGHYSPLGRAKQNRYMYPTVNFRYVASYQLALCHGLSSFLISRLCFLCLSQLNLHLF